MRKLFSLLDCSKGEPMDPLSGDTPEEIFEYSAERGAWFASCIAELGIKLPPHPNVDDPDKFEDNKGYVWTRTISSRGIDFKLDFFDPPESKPFISHSDGLLIIGIRMSLRDYSILTLGPARIKMHVINHKKVRFADLLNAISNHEKIPVTDFDTKVFVKNDNALQT